MIVLPIDSHIDQILDAVRSSRAAVVTAAPGAGKTTRVPPALVADGPVMLLQPRRVAARAMAARIASERGWMLGREVGWQIRFDRRYSDATRLLVVTEGILTARLQSDPLLSGFRTIILDEFHERSIHADLAITLARQAWRARDDLRIVVMSATLDSAAVAAFLDDCPVIDVRGRVHPIDIQYAAGRSIVDAAADVLAATRGQVLCFLPGAPEIRRAMSDLQRLADVDVVPLHGSLDAESQDAALRPSSRRRIIVATNIAETALTVPGVTAVIDSGLHKVARYDADRGIDSLETERITMDAADQRAGRAGRVAPGVVRRLWDARDRLRPHREPEIHRVDLAATALDVIAWGGDPRTLEWFDAPRDSALDAAIELLARLALVEAGTSGGWRLTAIGEQAIRVPLHPRLARMLIAAGGSRQMAQACALLTERHLLPPRTETTWSDLLSAIDQWHAVPPHVDRTARAIEQSADKSATRNVQLATSGEAGFLRAVLSGYPDRVAQRRARGSTEVLLASGTGAVLGRDSGVRDGEFLVALDVSLPQAVMRNQLPNMPVIRMASRVDRDWLSPTSSETVHRFDPESGRVRAATINRYDALILGEHPVRADPEIAARLLADAWLLRGPGEADLRLIRRLKFAGHEIDLASAVRTAAYGAARFDDIDLAVALPPDIARSLDREAPDTLLVPSGRSHRLEYRDDGSVGASVKLQELFGLAETPRIGRRKEPVVLSLLAPNGRPVQVTRDLRSFWDRTYPELRKELRGCYPKHPWPEDPWTAPPSARAKRR